MATTSTSKSDVVNGEQSSELFGGFIEMTRQHFLQIALLGVFLGALALALAVLLQHAVFGPLLCMHSMQCASAKFDSWNVAAIIVAVVALLGLVRLSVYRPLLIVLAALISLWGLGEWTAYLPWYEVLIWSIILYTLCYLAFSWLVRPRMFMPAAVMVVAAVLVIRLLPLI